MSYLREKFGYLKGLAEGLDIKDDTKESKLLLGMLDLLDEITFAIDDLDEEIGELDEYVEYIDDDLSVLEDEFYDMVDFDEEYEEELEVACPECGEIIDINDIDFTDEESKVVCPDCGTEFGIFMD